MSKTITPWHDKDGFFKYYTARSAKLTLVSAARKWSTPLLFNDPFDNQFDLHFEEPTEERADTLLGKFHSIIKSPQPLQPNQFGKWTPVVEMIRQDHQLHPDFSYSDAGIAYIKEGVREGMQRAIKRAPETNSEISRVMADTSVFCVSETHDNLLMWSHYAQNHSGAVIKFLSLQEVDSPLMLAQPVRYSKQMPRLGFEAMMDFGTVRAEILQIITLTKAEIWSYEKEWRIVATLRDKRKTYEIIPYAPQEVGAVYLGCRMSEQDRQEIITITRLKYPLAKIFQAEKHTKNFELVFRPIE